MSLAENRKIRYTPERDEIVGSNSNYDRKCFFKSLCFIEE